jgi:pilus assembly protein CpaC
MAPMAQVDKTGAVVVTIGGQSRFQMKSKKPIKEAFNENDKVVQVLADASDPSTLILIGRTAGTSKLELIDAAGVKVNYLVVVQRDMELLRNLIKKTVPTASVEVTPIGDSGTSIIVSGFTARETDRDTIRQLAEALGLRVAVNNVTVGGGGNVPHVQLNLTLAKVDRTRARARGANWLVNGGTVSGGSILGGLTSLSTQAAGAAAQTQTVGAISTAASVVPTATANLIGGIVPSDFQLVLAALKTEGLAKLVSSPQIVAHSGEASELLVGGQVPVISAAAGINGPGVTYRPVGTSLRFTPTVYGNGKVAIDVESIVTNVNNGQALATGFGTSPAFDEQRLRTHVIGEPGQTIAIGGLIESRVQGSVTKVPYLGDIPFVGGLFSYSTTNEQEVELVILITPYLIDPADSSQMPRPLPGSETRKPDDFEFYLETMLEAPRGQRNVFDGHHYVPAWKRSSTAGTYPCADGSCGTPVSAAPCATGNCPTAVTTAPMQGPVHVGNTGTTVPVIIRQPNRLPPANLPPASSMVTPPVVEAPTMPASGTVQAPVEPAPVPPAAMLAPEMPGKMPTAGLPSK